MSQSHTIAMMALLAVLGCGAIGYVLFRYRTVITKALQSLRSSTDESDTSGEEEAEQAPDEKEVELADGDSESKISAEDGTPDDEDVRFVLKHVEMVVHTDETLK